MQKKPTQIQTANRSKSRVTISDVSGALGLTKSTVSRALNGYPDISESTRNRVTRAAEKMGYQPLSQAQAIRTGRSRSIGLVLQFHDHDAQRPFLANFLTGVCHAASAENWTLTVSAAETEDDTLRMIERQLKERKADGFILPRTLIDDARIRFLREAEAPFVLFGRTLDPTDCAWFDILGEAAMRDAVVRLSAFGHRRIAFVNGGEQYNYSRLRHQGFLQGLADAGLPADPALIRWNALRTEDGAREAEALLRLPEPPTAFVFATDMAALGLYHAAQRFGLTVGRDLSLISYDGVPEAAFAAPPLTTYSVDTRRAGERLASLLIRRIRGEPVETLRETARATLIQRGSDGPCLLGPSDVAARVAASCNANTQR